MLNLLPSPGVPTLFHHFTAFTIFDKFNPNKAAYFVIHSSARACICMGARACVWSVRLRWGVIYTANIVVTSRSINDSTCRRLGFIFILLRVDGDESPFFVIANTKVQNLCW